MNNVPRPVMQSNLIQQFRRDFAVLAQVLAITAAEAGGAYRVVSCGACLNNKNQKSVFVEISLPNLDPFYLPLEETNVLGTPVELPELPKNNVTHEVLLGWVQGITYIPVQETPKGPLI